MPVILSPCRYPETPALSEFQAVNSPSKPLSRMSKHAREAVWYKLAGDIEAALAGKLSDR